MSSAVHFVIFISLVVNFRYNPYGFYLTLASCLTAVVFASEHLLSLVWGKVHNSHVSANRE